MITEILDISSEHISPETSAWLLLPGAADFIFSAFMNETGCVIPVLANDSLDYKTIPGDLVYVLSYAEQKNCDWIIISANGPHSDDLPKYEWS